MHISDADAPKTPLQALFMDMKCKNDLELDGDEILEGFNTECSRKIISPKDTFASNGRSFPSMTRIPSHVFLHASFAESVAAPCLNWFFRWKFTYCAVIIFINLVDKRLFKARK